MDDEVGERIRSSSGLQILEWLSPLDQKQRRAFARSVSGLFQQWQETRFERMAGKARPVFQDEDALKVAVLATATASELRRFGHAVLPRSIALLDVMRVLSPDWLDQWVEEFIEKHPSITFRLAPLWRAGLCRRPAGDARILGYYDHYSGLKLADHPEFNEDIWRFFSVEGGGELSLATHDKYRRNETWSDRLLVLAKDGTLDRQRLLDASLDALEMDFSQFRAGWYSRFHEALMPTLDEQSVRAERYLQLLSTSIPPTLSLALQALKRLQAASLLDPGDLLDCLAPALVARHKSAAMDALHLLAGAGKRAPARSDGIATLAITALASEVAPVQAKALEVIAGSGAAESPAMQALLAAHRTVVAPSVRARLAQLLAEPERPLPKVPALPVAPVPWAFAPVSPCVTPDDALMAYLAVLENPRDPIAVERAVDGIAQHGHMLKSASRLSPAAKRSLQILAKGTPDKLKLALAALGQAWCTDSLPTEILGTGSTGSAFSIREPSLAATFLLRCDEVITLSRSGSGLPLLSLPSDSSGEVKPAELAARLSEYGRAGMRPGEADLALALTRLSVEGRGSAAKLVDGQDGAARAFAFALGGDAVIGEGPVWAAAWLARRLVDQAGPRWPGPDPEPDAGVPARYELRVEKSGSPPYEWCRPSAKVSPPLRRPDPAYPGSLFHYRRSPFWNVASACGTSASEIAWAALVSPAQPEAFFASAIDALDASEKLADHPCIAYLTAFDRLKAEPPPMGYAVLAYYLASRDKSVCAQTIDKLSRLIERQLISASSLASAVSPFLLVGPFPTGRWTRSFADLSKAGPAQEAFVRDLITSILRFDAAEIPADIGGMIELLHELQLNCGLPVDDPTAAACLQALTYIGGKTGVFAKKLLLLQSSGARGRRGSSGGWGRSGASQSPSQLMR